MSDKERIAGLAPAIEMGDLSLLFGGALRPVQSKALATIIKMGALVGAIGVGEGKTLIACLAPLAWEYGRGKTCTAIVLVPARTRVEFHGLRARYAAQGYSVAWSNLFTHEYVSVHGLDSVPPCDLVIVDEAHHFSSDAARGKRFRAWVQKTGASLVLLSGSITRKSPAEFAALVALTLGVHAPTPSTWRGRQALAAVEGVGGVQVPSAMDIAIVRQLYPEGFPARFADCAGIVVAPSRLAALPLAVRPLPLPPTMSPIPRLMEQLQAAWALPGREYAYPTQVREAGIELGCGFYLRWTSPPTEQWYTALRAARQAMQLAVCFDPRMDTPGRVKRALNLPREIKDAVCALDALTPPRTAPEWVADVLREVAAFAKAHAPCIVFHAHCAVHEWAAKEGYDTTPFKRPATPWLSWRRYGEGWNLQHYANAIVLTPPSNGALWEQLLGRLHRSGQEKPVTYWVLDTPYTRRAMYAARESAAYIAGLLGPQKLMECDYGF